MVGGVDEKDNNIDNRQQSFTIVTVVLCHMATQSIIYSWTDVFWFNWNWKGPVSTWYWDAFSVIRSQVVSQYANCFHLVLKCISNVSPVTISLWISSRHSVWLVLTKQTKQQIERIKNAATVFGHNQFVFEKIDRSGAFLTIYPMYWIRGGGLSFVAIRTYSTSTLQK